MDLNINKILQNEKVKIPQLISSELFTESYLVDMIFNTCRKRCIGRFESNTIELFEKNCIERCYSKFMDGSKVINSVFNIN